YGLLSFCSGEVLGRLAATLRITYICNTSGTRAKRPNVRIEPATFAAICFQLSLDRCALRNKLTVFSGVSVGSLVDSRRSISLYLASASRWLISGLLSRVRR